MMSRQARSARTIDSADRAARDAAADLAEIVEGCLSAVTEEAAAVRAALAGRGIEDPVPASGGRHVDSGSGLHLYEWRLGRGTYDIRADDALEVELESGAGGRGSVARYDRSRRLVQVSTGDWLGTHPGAARLAFDPTWILECLRDRLREIAEDPEEFHADTALRLFGRLFPRTGRVEPGRDASAELNGPQRAALTRVLGSDAHFIWGPPGTGKTLLLGHAAAELAEWGRVLVVATTNAAVDEAARRVSAALGAGAVHANRIIRFGAEFSPTGLPALSLEAAVERAEADLPGGTGAAVVELEEELFGAAHRTSGPSSGISAGGPPDGTLAAGPRGMLAAGSRDGAGAAESTLRARIGRLTAAARRADDPELVARVGSLAAELHRGGLRLLRKADVVLTTCAGLTVREELRGLRFDSVLIDEASTAPLPYVLVAAVRAARCAAAIGDFQQLPPVVVSRGTGAVRWLSRDIFHEAGVVQPGAPGELPLPGERDQLCAMLTEQYRMRPAIRRLVSDLFYGGRLADAAASQLPVAEPPSGGPLLPEPLVLLDTTALGPRVERVDGSRANPVHAEAVLRLLELLGREGIHDVGVVTPYRIQARRLRGLTRARLGRLAPGNLEIATIHRFQGREKGVIVFDTVDAPPGASWFLNEGRNPDFPRLLNVALSRARDMLVMVGTADGLLRTLPEEALLNRVVARIAAEGCTVDAARPLELRGRVVQA